MTEYKAGSEYVKSVVIAARTPGVLEPQIVKKDLYLAVCRMTKEAIDRATDTYEFNYAKWVDDSTVLIDALNDMDEADKVTDYLSSLDSSFNKISRRLLDDEEL